MDKDDKLHKDKCTMSFAKDSEWCPLDRIKDNLSINIKAVIVLSISWKTRMHFIYTEMVNIIELMLSFSLCVYIF